MDKSKITIEPSGNTITISRTVSFMGSELNRMEDGESLTLDFSMALEIDELARIIEKTDTTKPGWRQQLAVAAAIELVKTGLKWLSP